MQRHSPTANVVAAIIAFTCILSMTCVGGAPLKHETTSRLLINGLFEGDLKLSEETILRYYNFSSVPGGDELYEEMMEARESEGKSRASEIGSDESELKHNRKERGAANDKELWSDNIVRYEISSSISESTANLIRGAMDNLEDNTCLRFVVRSGQTDYIKFDNTNDGCYTTAIGRRGGMQTINLQPNDATGFGCEHFGVIVHEIVHAIGFWHEQSRPDRDDYVTINFDNVKNGKEHNFMTRNNIDSLGSGYDYGSIMHYGQTAFVRDGCTGCTTIDVNNPVEYSNQGSPFVGQHNALSTRDIEQINSLYSCPPLESIGGDLLIFARAGNYLPDEDGSSNDSDPYIEFIAIDENGYEVRMTTSVKQGDEDPDWNESLNFGRGTWRALKVRVYDQDIDDADDPLSNQQTWTLSSPTTQTSVPLPYISQFTAFQFCYRGYVYFDIYYFF